jgi:alkanesulfonate monooxygenase SsuD/methylene tetrahydromethanopterin reductase-like flavin-dependent oxidoreductase (luciferase family)
MGFGRSTPREWTIFGIDPDSTRPVLEEVLHVMPRIWTEEGEFTYDSDYFHISPIHLVPRMYTKPHPPMWIAATSDDSFALAGRSGVGVLGLTLFSPLSELAKRLEVYREAQKDQKPVSPFTVNNQTGAFTSVYVAPTMDEAIHSGAPQAAAWYLAKVFAYYGAVPVKDGEGGEHFRFDREAQIAAIEASGSSAGREALLKIVDGIEVSNEEFFEAMDQEDQFIMGTPDHVIKKMEKYQGIGLDHLMCMMQGGPSLPHEKIVESMKLMGETVIPHFHDQEKSKETAATASTA